MTAHDWLFIAGWFGVSITITALFSLLAVASKQSEESDRRAREPYVSRDVTLVYPAFDWSRYEQEVTS